MICPLCKGSQNLICFVGGKPQWWNCPSCDGQGTTMSFSTGKPIVVRNAEKRMKMGKNEIKLQK